MPGTDGHIHLPSDTEIVDTNCIIVGGTGSQADPYSISPVIDPIACNGLVCTANGLRAPTTVVLGDVGPTPGRVEDNLQSIDVVVIPPPGPNACPQNYQIQAYLTPLRGDVGPVADVNLLPGGTWENTALVDTLPDPGVYWVSADVATNICVNFADGGNANLWTEVRIVDSTGVVVKAPRFGTQMQKSLGLTENFQVCHTQSTTISGLVGVTAAMGSRTIRVQAFFQNSGQSAATIQSVLFQGDWSFLSWHKIAD